MNDIGELINENSNQINPIPNLLESVSDLVWMNDIGELINENSNQINPIPNLLESVSDLVWMNKKRKRVGIRLAKFNLLFAEVSQ